MKKRRKRMPVASSNANTKRVVETATEREARKWKSEVHKFGKSLKKGLSKFDIKAMQIKEEIDRVIALGIENPNL
tara:strand:+ start:361 stop:585 length:225 start_codon:yes stop_codon:yes gene_type:complete